MTKKFNRGKAINSLKLYKLRNYQNPPLFKDRVVFTKTLIVRGIGYRAFALNNYFSRVYTSTAISNFLSTSRPLYTDSILDDTQEIAQIGSFELPDNRYVVVRAGHTQDLYAPLNSATVDCKTSKKDRKLVIFSSNSQYASNLAKVAHKYREPSVYTGRGVRIKHCKPLRKAGKKDKQKGRAF